MLKYIFAIIQFGFISLAVSQPFTPYKTRLNSINLSPASPFQNIKTESIGPTIMSGRVSDVEVNPLNTIEMVVAYASGGVWYTQNNGQSFKPIFDHQHSMTIGDIAVNWSTFTIWVGTGESNSSRSSYAGTGIYTSNDTGKTWNHCGLEETHHIGKILLHPTNPNIAYVAAMGHLYSQNEERGVFKTVDAGKNWQKILYIDAKTGAIDLCFDPQNNETLLAAMWERQRSAWNFKGSGEGSGIYRSKNEGSTWNKIYSAPNLGRIGLAPFIKNGRSGLYALIDDQNTLPKPVNDTDKIYLEDLLKIEKQDLNVFLGLKDDQLNAYLKENDFPEKYDAKAIKKLIKTQKNTITDIIKYTGNANQNLFNTNYKGSIILKLNDLDSQNWDIVNDSITDLYYTYGYYFGQIRVNPTNADEIYILGVVLARSTNGGKTFKKLTDDNVHADHHVLWINPLKSSHLVNGNDGGLNISYDYGQNWVKCNSPAVGQFYSITTDNAIPYNVYGGLQDNGVWKGPRTYSTGNGWHQNGHYPYEFIMGGDGMQVAVDLKQNLIYTGYQFGNYYRLDQNTGQSTYITPKHELGEMPYRFNWQTPIQLSKHSNNTLYFGGNYLFRSLDQGVNWKKISPDLTTGGILGNVPYGTLTTLDESALKFGLIYTGSDDGLIQITKDGGSTWTNISIPNYNNFWVSRVQASSHLESRVYATLNAYRMDIFSSIICVSDDYGKHWRSISNNLPLEPVNVIREDLVNPNILYAGTDNELFVSINLGRTWNKLGQLPRVAVHDLAINSQQNDLVVGTHGRSIYVISLNEINSLDSITLSKNLAAYKLPIIKASKNWGQSNSYWSLPKQSRMSIPYYSAVAQNVQLTLTDSTGLILYQDELKGLLGINYVPYSFIANQNQTLSKFVRRGKDNTYYLVPSKYTIQFKSVLSTEQTDLVLEYKKD